MYSLLILTALLAPWIMPLPTTPPQPAASVVANMQASICAPIRNRRPLFLGTELGINGLTGLGFLAGYQLSTHVALDAALGLSAQLSRTGVRGRYNFLNCAMTPYVGLGLMYTSGTPFDIRSQIAGPKLTYRIDAAMLGQAVAGVSWVQQRGFTLMASLGWTQLLTRGTNVIIKQGNPTPHVQKQLKSAAGSGLVAALGVGYSF